MGAVAFQSTLQFDGIVAGVEDEQRNVISFGQPTKQTFDLFHGHLVGILRRLDPPHVDGRHPRVALEGEPRDQLVGPASDEEGLPGRVPGRVVVVPPPRTRLGIAAAPDADVDGVNGAAAPVAGRRILGEQVP
jgi:hypothetical protein